MNEEPHNEDEMLLSSENEGLKGYSGQIPRELGSSELAERLDHIEIQNTVEGGLICNYIWKNNNNEEEEPLPERQVIKRSRINNFMENPKSPRAFSSVAEKLRKELAHVQTENNQLKEHLESFKRLYEDRFALPKDEEYF